MKCKISFQSELIILVSTISFLFLLFLSSCHFPNTLNRKLVSTDSTMLDTVLIQKENQFLKVHTKNGELYILNKWYFNKQADSLIGRGTKYSMFRISLGEGTFRLSKKDIVLYESNILNKSFAGGGLTVMSILTAGLGFYCITTPKACFGSCPTFYAWDGKEMSLQAESFSSSVAPSMEAEDIDALYLAQPKSPTFELGLTNEAMETHVINYANLLAVKRPQNGRIFATNDNQCYEALNITAPIFCQGPEGDITDKVIQFDKIERFSKSDSFDLAEKEIIEIEFPKNSNCSKGIVVGFRQTLLTTYLFYQTLAYMGTQAGDMIAKLEAGDENLKSKIKYPGSILGNMEFSVLVNNEWKKFGEISEVGPISTDVVMLQIPKNDYNNNIKIRISMAKGLWRINYLAISDLGEMITPLELKPGIIFSEEKENREALELLSNKDQYLITYPGDKYTLIYQLPDDYQNYELFLKAKGYYLEWMRDVWIAEENPEMLTKLLFQPEIFFKEHAPLFKELEPKMEDTFWRSRYVNP